MARLTRLVGEEHFMTLSCAANLALDLSADGADEEAKALCRDDDEHVRSGLRAE